MKKKCELGLKVGGIMIITAIITVIVALSIDTTSTVDAQIASSAWKSSFDLQDCDFTSNGANTYFVLKPGYKIVLDN